MILLLTLAYDGTRYFGWQKTPMGPSIEGELQHALETLLQHPVELQAASRTDRGVHAHGQVVSCTTSKTIDRLDYRLNCLLPPDIRVLSVMEAPETFHPTLDAIYKEYRYQIYHGPVLPPHCRYTWWHVPRQLDVEAMRQAALLLTGQHDFATFRNQRKDLKPSTERTIHAIDIEERDCGLTIALRGNSFLYKMARNLVGTLVYVGCGKIALADLPAILASKDRPRAGITAPAHGLTLHEVFYPPRSSGSVK